VNREVKMDDHIQRDLVGRVLDLHARRTTTMAEDVMHIPAERYVSDELHAREQIHLFRRQPVFACLSVDIPAPGDAVTLDVGGVPVVVVRGSDRHVRAFVNVCRHRGATVVPSATRALRSMSCPFHGWVYDRDDGHLVGRPRSCEGFAGLDDGCLGLPPLGTGEADGIVAVRVDGPEPVDVEQWLAGLSPELRGLRYDTLVPYRTETSQWRCNWKLLLDTFLESYHVFALHKTSLASFYLGIASPFDAFGPHNRIVVPQTSILEQADEPPEKWQLLPHAVLQYFVAPNVVVSNLYGYVMTWRFVPRGVAETEVHHRLYTYEAVEDDARRAHYDQRFDAARSVTGNEDFPASEGVHRNLASGSLAATVAGRNEPGMVHFHRTIERAMVAGLATSTTGDLA
jgi:phenylpropionate dioxygenase-like ring-hydroxylating dioxygenase large terminal subunit